jgi:HlyD family secretion protein
MTANAEIVLEERKDALLIPEAALVYEKDKSTFAQLLDASAKQGYRKVPVKTGISNGQRTQITDGLEEGDRVVLP